MPFVNWESMPTLNCLRRLLSRDMSGRNAEDFIFDPLDVDQLYLLLVTAGSLRLETPPHKLRVGECEVKVEKRLCIWNSTIDGALKCAAPCRP